MGQVIRRLNKLQTRRRETLSTTQLGALRLSVSGFSFVNTIQVFVRQPGVFQLAKPNYSFQKRQKELAKQAKKEEKRLRKLNKAEDASQVEPGDTVEPGEVPTE